MDNPRHIDLHNHSTASDGTLSPAALVRQAFDAGLSAMAITDHDCLDGIDKALAEGTKLGIEVVPGVELSTKRPDGGSLHMLGYWIRQDHSELNQTLATIREGRHDRNARICKKLAELGAPIDASRVADLAGGDVVGRPHIAQALVEAGHVKSKQEACDRYLAHGKPAYQSRRRLGPKEAIALLHAAGGLAVLAHPAIHDIPKDELKAEIQAMVEAGLDGIEVHYPHHNQATQTWLLELAAEFNLAVTGGSDFHGEFKANQPMGVPFVPAALLEKLKARRKD